jgi:hypothetical protein
MFGMVHNLPVLSGGFLIINLIGNIVNLYVDYVHCLFLYLSWKLALAVSRRHENQGIRSLPRIWMIK